jgi:hypothetical protein
MSVLSLFPIHKNVILSEASRVFARREVEGPRRVYLAAIARTVPTEEAEAQAFEVEMVRKVEAMWKASGFFDSAARTVRELLRSE